MQMCTVHIYAEISGCEMFIFVGGFPKKPLLKSTQYHVYNAAKVLFLLCKYNFM